MSTAPQSSRPNRLLTAFLAVDLGFLWVTVVHYEMLVILYSSGLWVGYGAGLAWAIARSLVLAAAYHFRFSQLLMYVIGLELMAGVMVSVVDLWVYHTTDCECLLQMNGAVTRLLIRSAALAVVLAEGRKTKEEGRVRNSG